jgi:oxygen-independent coproporphyrinogen-3 oxidase
VPSTPPEGEAVPWDGSLPGSALTGLGTRPFGVYVHVPFCATRCGYCDFNTYTATELGGGASQAAYAATAADEVRLARRVLGDTDVSAATVFFGGGTPTLLPPADLDALLRSVRDELGLRPDAEVTTEANPDSVDRDSLRRLRDAGFTRVSFGMQSAVPHVLATLDRTHDPERVPLVVQWAREAGFDGVSLDLIYGTPGESQDDWRTSLDAALACGPDHLSAYALIVEEGTRLAGQVRRGEVPAPDDDDLADRYLLADEVLAAAGMQWYEVSNWATATGQRARHNEGYWLGHDWWGVGPGAHSHVGGTRWWNVRHPAAYATRLADGASPAQAREVLDDDQRRAERVLLGIRLVEGHPLDDLTDRGRDAARAAVGSGLLEPAARGRGGPRPARLGRLLHQADVDRVAVVLAVVGLDAGDDHEDQTDDEDDGAQSAGDDRQRDADDQQADLEVQRLDRLPAGERRLVALHEHHHQRCDEADHDRADVREHRPHPLVGLAELAGRLPAVARSARRCAVPTRGWWCVPGRRLAAGGVRGLGWRLGHGVIPPVRPARCRSRSR